MRAGCLCGGEAANDISYATSGKGDSQGDGTVRETAFAENRCRSDDARSRHGCPTRKGPAARSDVPHRILPGYRGRLRLYLFWLVDRFEPRLADKIAFK
jgi:hypothetical protein